MYSLGSLLVPVVPKLFYSFHMGKRLILLISLNMGIQKVRNRLFLMLSSITSALKIFCSRFYDPLLGSKSTIVTVEEFDASNF